ncbi:hypothetical protein BGZ96_010863, partial [Linnemannia gamsii]
GTPTKIEPNMNQRPRRKINLCNNLIEYMCGSQPGVVIASSGIGSNVLHQGHTALSAFYIPISITIKTT